MLHVVGQQVDMCSTMPSFSACTIMPLQELNLHALAGAAAPVIHSLSSLSFPVSLSLSMLSSALFSLSLSLLPSTFLFPSVYPCFLFSLSLSLLPSTFTCICMSLCSTGDTGDVVLEWLPRVRHAVYKTFAELRSYTVP